MTTLDHTATDTAVAKAAPAPAAQGEKVVLIVWDDAWGAPVLERAAGDSVVATAADMALEVGADPASTRCENVNNGVWWFSAQGVPPSWNLAERMAFGVRADA